MYLHNPKSFPTWNSFKNSIERVKTKKLIDDIAETFDWCSDVSIKAEISPYRRGAWNTKFEGEEHIRCKIEKTVGKYGFRIEFDTHKGSYDIDIKQYRAHYVGWKKVSKKEFERLLAKKTQELDSGMHPYAADIREAITSKQKASERSRSFYDALDALEKHGITEGIAYAHIKDELKRANENFRRAMEKEELYTKKGEGKIYENE